LSDTSNCQLYWNNSHETPLRKNEKCTQDLKFASVCSPRKCKGGH
jgi:hypothetical protein